MLLAVTGLVVATAPAQSGAPSGNITRVYYVNNPGYGPNFMYMKCIKTNGANVQIGLTIGQASNLNYGCQYVYQVYVPAGGWVIQCDNGDGNFHPKWSGEGWKNWPGTNWIACHWL